MRRLLAPLLAVPLLSLAPSPAAHAVATCQGRPATIESTGGTATGSDDDDVIVVSGAATVSAGGGDDVICLVGPGADGRTTPAAITLDAGPGADRVELVGINWDASMFTGTLGPGKDVLRVGRAGVVTRVLGDIDGGVGSDTLVMAAGRLVVADLIGGDILVKDSRDAFGGHSRVVTPHFENVDAAAATVGVSGGNERNTIEVHACRGYVSAGDGADRLSLSTNRVDGLRISCPKGFSARFDGEGGPDRLSGLRWSDRLIGGPGRDVAVGGGGHDICRAEVKRSCS